MSAESPAPKSLNRRIIVIGAGAVLAIYLVLSFISHQGLHATQTAAPHPVASKRTAAPETGRPTGSVVTPADSLSPVNAQPEPAAATSADPAKPVSKPAPALDPIVRREIKTLWEGGKYADAMDLVDEVLVANPANSEARGWKKRIRAAQQAEAAIK